MMKFFIFSLLIPNILCATDSKGSPLRNNIHSKSASEIPSALPVETVTQAMDIPQRPTRSTSELEIQTMNPWASPTSSSVSPPSWTASRIVRRTAPKSAAHRPQRLTPEQLNNLKEKKWRTLRRDAYKPAHKRSNSHPCADEARRLSLLMELSEAYGDMMQIQYNSALIQQQAIQTQKQYMAEAGKAGALLALMETSDFEGLFNETVKLHSALKQETTRREGIEHVQDERYNHILTRMNDLAVLITGLANRLEHSLPASTPDPVSPRSSIEKDKRSRTSGSFLGSVFGSHKD